MRHHRTTTLLGTKYILLQKFEISYFQIPRSLPFCRGMNAGAPTTNTVSEHAPYRRHGRHSSRGHGSRSLAPGKIERPARSKGVGVVVRQQRCPDIFVVGFFVTLDWSHSG